MLALLSALPGFYWAAGGTIGLATVGGAIEELALPPAGPAGVALGISRGGQGREAGAGAGPGPPWGHRVPRRLLGGVAWAASVVLTLYGGLLVGVGALVVAGVIGPWPIDRRRCAGMCFLWDLWFLVWGLLLGVASWDHGRQSRQPRGAQ